MNYNIYDIVVIPDGLVHKLESSISFYLFDLIEEFFQSTILPHVLPK